MIVRVWRAKCYRHNIKEFEEWIRTDPFPILRKQPGCVYAVVGRNLESEPPEMFMVTVWKDRESMLKFTGTRWKEPVVLPKEKQYLNGKPEVEHFELVELY